MNNTNILFYHFPLSSVIFIAPFIPVKFYCHSFQCLVLSSQTFFFHSHTNPIFCF